MGHFYETACLHRVTGDMESEMECFCFHLNIRDSYKRSLKTVIQTVIHTVIIEFLFVFFADLQFPIDLSNVAKDHPFLENDPLQSLYRRLVALNRCATMRLDNAHHSKHQSQVHYKDNV